MLTRKIGAMIRGKATPFQIFLACVLGMTLGMLPTFTTAIGPDDLARAGAGDPERQSRDGWSVHHSRQTADVPAPPRELRPRPRPA